MTAHACPFSKCSHYGPKGRSKNQCFELINYPDKWGKTCNPSRNKARASITESKIDSKQTVEKFSALLTKTSKNGKVLKVFLPVMNNTSIIVSGATDYMTCDSRQVQALKPSMQNFRKCC